VATVISKNTLNQLLESAELVKQERGQPKVLRLPDEKLILKCHWAPDELPLLERLSWKKRTRHLRHSRRFVANAKKLKRRNIISTEVQNFYLCKNPQVAIIAYRELEGKTLGEHLAQSKPSNPSILKSFVRFLCKLHTSNIYFRAGHEGNYLYDGKQFKLIDIDNTTFRMNLRRSAKNVAYLIEHANRERELIDRARAYELLHYYFELQNVSISKIEKFLKRFNTSLTKRGYLAEPFSLAELMACSTQPAQNPTRAHRADH